MITGTTIYGETVVRLRQHVIGRDLYGTDVHATTETAIAGCTLQRRSEMEDVQGRDQVIHGLTLYAPPGTDLEVTDRVRIRGHVYAVEGRPDTWISPFTGQDAGVEASVVRITG